MNRLAVIGQPISHSLSPAMHTAALRALGLEREWSYVAIELSPERFSSGVGELRERGYVGANVTVPHKLAALALADDASASARAIGASNTLTFSPAGVRADNTDAPGLIAALPHDPSGRRALVLGAGGAARASAWALAGAGAEVVVHNRTRRRAAELAAELEVRVLDPPEAGAPLAIADFDLLVNATSVGLAIGNSARGRAGLDLKDLGLAADGFSDRMVVVDLVYGAAPTELTAAATAAGATVVDGLEVLVRQGAESFRIWTGSEPPLEAMRAAIRSE